MWFILKLSEILTSESTPRENRQKLFQQIVLFEQILITEGWSSNNIFFKIPSQDEILLHYLHCCSFNLPSPQPQLLKASKDNRSSILPLIKLKLAKTELKHFSQNIGRVSGWLCFCPCFLSVSHPQFLGSGGIHKNLEICCHLALFAHALKGRRNSNPQWRWLLRWHKRLETIKANTQPQRHSYHPSSQGYQDPLTCVQ